MSYSAIIWRPTKPGIPDLTTNEFEATYPKDPLNNGARFLYLNRSCWNGLYRVNQKGEFNVPMGSRTNFCFETDDFPRASRILKNAEILACDFEINVNAAEEGDFLFIDPPYTVKHNQNGFVKYNEKIFSWEDQIRLRDSLVRARRRGVQILATNADHESVRELYRAYPRDFRMIAVKRFSNIAASSKNRGVTTELVVGSYFTKKMINLSGGIAIL